MIPAIIHYAWFGGDIPDFEQECIASWERVMPDWTYMLWDESNCDLKATPFVAGAYKERQFNLVSDYIRLKRLFEYGGIWLDSDVEVYKPLDKLLSYDFFIANKYESEDCAVPTIHEAVMGAVAKDSVIRRALFMFDQKPLWRPSSTFSKDYSPTSITRTLFRFLSFAEKAKVFPPEEWFDLADEFSNPYSEKMLGHPVNSEVLLRHHGRSQQFLL